MRKLIVLIFLVFIGEFAYSQQFPLQSQYQFNYSIINPSIIAENNYTSIRGSFRQQWVGFSDNPIATQNLSLYRGFGKNGLGVNVFNDETGGAFNKSGLSFSYAHKVVFTDYDVFFGISGGFSKVNLLNVSDPSIINREDIVPDVTFGTYLKYDNFRLGLSVPGLLNENMELTNSNDNKTESNLYAMLSYEHQINDMITLYPSALLKTADQTRQLDVNLNLKIKDQIWVGASYRQDFGPSIFVGIDFGKLFSIYSYDLSTNEAYSYSGGSHELSIGYDFDYSQDSIVEKKKSNEEEKVDLSIYDLDKDGVADSIDLCPDQYGSVQAHGCVDVDRDGIPNEFDLCPNLFGKLELQGCPEITQFEKNIVYNALNDLKFDFDKAEINYSSYPTLTDMSILLLKNPKMFLHITGFSSSEGSKEYNLGLSARRAKAVQTFFIERGVDKSRLILDYFGEANPLNNNENELQKAKNRRVEFSLEYHIYAVEESNDLKKKYKKALMSKNLDYSFLKKINSKFLIDNSKFNKIDVVNDKPKKISSTNTKPVIDDVVTKQDIDNKIIEKLDESKYILVISVLSNESNALNYIKNNSSVKYELIDGKYYFYEKSDSSKEKLITIKSSYKKDSWIKQVR